MTNMKQLGLPLATFQSREYSFDNAEAAALAAAWPSTGVGSIPLNPQKRALDQCWSAIKASVDASACLAKCNRVFVTAGKTPGQCIYNWVDPSTFFSWLVAIPTDPMVGSDRQMRSNFNPSTQGAGKFIQDDASVALYFKTSKAAAANVNYIDMDANGTIVFDPRNAAGNMAGNINDTVGAQTFRAFSVDHNGLVILTRANSSTINMWHKGSFNIIAAGVTSNAPGNGLIRFGANAGAIVLICLIGARMLPAETQALVAILLDYLEAIGVTVL